MIPFTSFPFRYPDRIAASAWFEHVPFMFWIVDALQPRRFVELGVDWGVSYCAACQTVGSRQLPTQCYGVDTWKGDAHAGFYGEEVYADLAPYHDTRYSAFSRLVRSTFDEAVEHFEDASIDLLHIDGLHSYEAVRHDFETWWPKLTENAVVMFHDTNVRERGFGVFRLWGELAAERPHFEFLHGHGLGVLAMGRSYPPAVEALFAAGVDAHGQETVRTQFAHLGRAVAEHVTLRAPGTQADGAPRPEPEPIAPLPDAQSEASEITEWQAVIAREPENAHALASLSLVLSHNERIDEAIEAINRAIALAPEAGQYAHRGNLHSIKGDLDAAVADMREAVTRAPEFAERLTQLEAALAEQGTLG
ncbi:class I SAM-dependent methyltransferase [Consotaella aegiceratis]|uniref:class I SAM-dependent methyltransferase n=1 Tax=Consotaella aegiceratis TaxID=3097961 RepID=UPI002F429A0E